MSESSIKPEGPPADTEVQAALASVLGGLLASAKADREASTPYQHLFAAYADGGVARAVFAAERKMTEAALDLAHVLREQAGVEVGNELWDVILALPLAMRLVRRDIVVDMGNACCADKARSTLKTYFYDQLGMDVAVTPFDPKPPSSEKDTPP